MSLNLDLINRGAEGELVLIGRLDSVTSEEAGKVFDDLTERFDDLILNTLGVMIGYGIYAAVRRLKRKRTG